MRFVRDNRGNATKIVRSHRRRCTLDLALRPTPVVLGTPSVKLFRPLSPVLLSLGLALGLALPAKAQVPHTASLDFDELQEIGLAIAQEAAQRSQFQQYDIALQQVELATQLVPNDFRIWAVAADIYLRTDKLDDGIGALKTARKLEPTDPAIHLALGTAYFRKQDYVAATTNYERGVQLKPDSPGALFDLGNAYYVTDRFKEAVDTYEKAVDLGDEFWEAINNIGLVRYEQGKREDAIAAWKQALSYNEKAAEPQLALAVALYAKGERKQSLRLAEAALKSDGQYGDVEYLRDQLWGDRLVKDTEIFLATPQMKSVLARVDIAR